jgi:hypothetical protein
MDQFLLPTWLFGYRLCLFSKGHNFHIQSPFSWENIVDMFGKHNIIEPTSWKIN